MCRSELEQSLALSVHRSLLAFCASEGGRKASYTDKDYHMGIEKKDPDYPTVAMTQDQYAGLSTQCRYEC